MSNEFKVKNGLIVEGQITSTGITSSLFGTASWAISASWAPDRMVESGSTYPITSSWAINSIDAISAISASWASASLSSSHALNADNVISASHALDADNAISAAYALNTDSAVSASWASASLSSSYSLTASYIVPTTVTQQITSSWSINSVSSVSASFASSSISASYALSSSYVMSSSYAVSSSHALNSNIAISSSYATTAATASSLSGFNFYNSSSTIDSTSSAQVVLETPTGSYISVFFDYAAKSASNIRAGTIFGAWIDTTVTYSEFTTVDVGNTSEVSMSIVLNGANVRLLSSASLTPNWNIRAIARYI